MSTSERSWMSKEPIDQRYKCSSSFVYKFVNKLISRLGSLESISHQSWRASLTFAPPELSVQCPSQCLRSYIFTSKILPRFTSCDFDSPKPTFKYFKNLSLFLLIPRYPSITPNKSNSVPETLYTQHLVSPKNNTIPELKRIASVGNNYRWFVIDFVPRNVDLVQSTCTYIIIRISNHIYKI